MPVFKYNRILDLPHWEHPEFDILTDMNGLPVATMPTALVKLLDVRDGQYIRIEVENTLNDAST